MSIFQVVEFRVLLVYHFVVIVLSLSVFIKMSQEKVVLNKEQTEQLIDHVRCRECIFNMKHRNYHRQDVKDNNWREMARDMGIDGEWNQFKLNSNIPKYYYY